MRKEKDPEMGAELKFWMLVSQIILLQLDW
jgi:hypothetical protein